MRGHAPNRLVVIEIVTELGHIGVVFILANHQFALKQPFGPQPFAQVLHQRRRFGPALAQQIAYPVQHRLHGGEVRLFVFTLHHRAHRDHVGGGFVSGHQRRIGKQGVGQRFQPGLARQLAFGAALEFERQVQVFELLLGRRSHQRGQQGGRHLALLLNRLDHRLQAVAQLTQIPQAGFQLAQLDVVQAVGHFLAIACNEWHGGTAVKQFHGGLHLLVLNPDFLRDLRDDFLHECRGRQPRAD